MPVTKARMRAPEGSTGICLRGVPHEVDKKGETVVALVDVEAAKAHGYVLVGSVEEESEAEQKARAAVMAELAETRRRERLTKPVEELTEDELREELTEAGQEIGPKVKVDRMRELVVELRKPRE